MQDGRQEIERMFAIEAMNQPKTGTPIPITLLKGATLRGSTRVSSPGVGSSRRHRRAAASLARRIPAESSPIGTPDGPVGAG